MTNSDKSTNTPSDYPWGLIIFIIMINVFVAFIIFS